jgi:RNA ligase (TIGR02306 family)
MATFEVTIETITVKPHPDADRLELAVVGLYNVVVPKGVYTTGDKVLYIPEYAVLPQELVSALGLDGKLSGSKKDRVKPVKLRGALSQGVVAPLTVLPEGTDLGLGDFAPVLGITKYQPAIPTSMSGDVEGKPELVKWIDIENLKKFPHTFNETNRVHVSEKVHGSCTLFTTVYEDGAAVERIVTSKGLGEKQIALKESENVIYWRTVKEQNLEGFADFIRTTLTGEGVADIVKVAVFGEVYGSKVQDLHYGKTGGELGYMAFDSYVMTADGNGFWVNPQELTDLATQFGVPVVPTLFVGQFNLDKVIELASGPETVSGEGKHIREGVVIRLTDRPFGYSDGAAQVAKYVSDDYLTRKGGTEYQ